MSASASLHAQTWVSVCVSVVVISGLCGRWCYVWKQLHYICRQDNGNTPLHLACKESRWAAAKQLMVAGTATTITNKVIGIRSLVLTLDTQG